MSKTSAPMICLFISLRYSITVWVFPTTRASPRPFMPSSVSITKRVRFLQGVAKTKVLKSIIFKISSLLNC